MRDHIHLFIIYTLLQIAFTVLYCLLAKNIGTTVFIGSLLYAASMSGLYLLYRKQRYKKQRQDLLDALL